MKSKKHLVVLSLALASAWAVAGDTMPAAAISASAWTTPYNHSVTPSASAAPLSVAVATQRAEPVARAAAESSQEGRSNGRLMLIGGLLIGVIALRSRKNLA